MTPLTSIFISKVRVKLLQIFLTHPDEIFYVRQLVRLTKQEINAVRRELAHMEKFDMVSKEARGNRLYYGFQKNYLLYDQLAEIICKTTGLAKQIIKQRNKLGKISYVVFSGNFAKHLPPKNPEEIDLILIGDIVLPEVNSLIHEEEAKRGREINYTIMTNQELQVRKSGKDPFLSSILSQSRVMIIGNEEKFIS